MRWNSPQSESATGNDRVLRGDRYCGWAGVLHAALRAPRGDASVTQTHSHTASLSVSVFLQKHTHTHTHTPRLFLCVLCVFHPHTHCVSLVRFVSFSSRARHASGGGGEIDRPVLFLFLREKKSHFFFGAQTLALHGGPVVREAIANSSAVRDRIWEFADAVRDGTVTNALGQPSYQASLSSFV